MARCRIDQYIYGRKVLCAEGAVEDGVKGILDAAAAGELWSEARKGKVDVAGIHLSERHLLLWIVSSDVPRLPFMSLFT